MALPTVIPWLTGDDSVKVGSALAIVRAVSTERLMRQYLHSSSYLKRARPNTFAISDAGLDQIKHA